MACLNTGIKFEPGEIELYRQSWDQTYKTTKKLFEAVKQLKGHNITETISLNDARNCIIALSKPVEDTIKLIDMNLKELKDVQEICASCDNDISEFQKVLKSKGFESRREELDRPKTVCTHSDCVKRVAIGQSSRTDTLYVTECHQECYLSGIPIETTNNDGLANCASMDNGYCKTCSHTYKIHMHVTYVVHIEEKEFLSDDTQKKINAKKTKKEQQKELIKELELRSKELAKEKAEIFECAVTFGVFLKKNAIVPYNDTFVDYMDMLIYEEQSKDQRHRDQKKIEQLQKDKSTYLQKKNVLEETLNHGCGYNEDIITPEEIIKLKQKLMKLKHNGKQLSETLSEY